MMNARTSLFTSLAIAASLGLAGCGGSSDNDDTVTEPEMMMEEPDAATVDLGNARTATAAAATAAGTASTNAAADAKRATDATENLATLQTGETAAALAKESSDYADMAEAESMTAQAAKTAADAATTPSAAGAQQNIAEAAQEAAEGHAAMAKEKADMAVAAAMMEFNFSSDRDLSVGESEVNADMARREKDRDQSDADSKQEITGHVGDNSRLLEGTDAQRHSLPGLPVRGYVQAVEARNLIIGRQLDTTDNKARISMIHSYAGSQEVRVYAEASTDDQTSATPGFDVDLSPANLHIWTNSEGTQHLTREDITVPTTVPGTAAFNTGTGGTNVAPPSDLRSIGMHYKADHVAATTPVTGDGNRLNAEDTIESDTKPKEVWTYTSGGNRYHVVQISSRAVAGGTSRVSYQHVDIMAPAAPDGSDADDQLDLRVITADLPQAHKYSHVNFGVWAELNDSAKGSDGDVQTLKTQGIGWVHNIDDSGMTPHHVTGKATYEGDWVGVVERRNSSSKGPFTMNRDTATLKADFEDDTLEAELDNLATLKGTLSGNAFEGDTVTNIAHRDLNANGTFEGSFRGGIYGADGSEAAGVFHFDGGSAGAFSGSFGGKYDADAVTQ